MILKNLFKKPLVIDCFVSERNAHVYRYAKIDHANNFIPEWWKKLDKSTFDFASMDSKNTMKSCMGFINHFQNGFILPMWSDLAVKFTQGRLEYKFADGTSVCSSHPVEQRMGFFMSYTNLKIESPWLIRSEKDVMFNYLPTFWNNNENDPYQVVPATIDFYYQYGIAVNTIIPNRPLEFMIPFGKPMVHLMPLTEREIDLRIHLVSDQEWGVLGTTMSPLTFSKKYNIIKRKLKDDNKSCPFNFRKKI